LTGEVELLAWDTAFFGFPVGRADLGGADDAALAAIEADAHRLGIACLYATLEAEHLTSPVATGVLAQRRGFRLIEVSLVLECPATLAAAPDPGDGPPPTDVVRDGTPADVAALGDCIDRLAHWSRFAADPRFGLAAARRLVEAGVDRAARGAEDRQLLVAEACSGPVGFATITCAGGEPSIELISTVAPDTGVARRLVEEVQARTGRRPMVLGQIAARNTACLRFFERLGCRTVGTRAHLHRWFDEATP
jgi:hypothetical protein